MTLVAPPDRATVGRATALAPLLASHTDDHVRDRVLAGPVIAALRDAGMLRLLLPRALGGDAIAPSAYIDTLATLAAADAATAWVVMTASTSTLTAAYFERATAEAIWPRDATPLLAGVFAPSGTATVGDDAARVRGRWAWASGCRHADWAIVGALTDSRRHVIAAVPMATTGVTIVDTWDPLGLAGTGSNDLVVDDVAVAPGALTSVFDRAPWCDEPLSRVPMFGLLALGVAAVGLGIARGALDAVGARLRGAERDPGSTALAAYATLDGRWRAARALMIDRGDAALDDATRGASDPARRGELRIAAAHAAQESAAIVRAAFHLHGGAAVPRRSPLARAVADAEVMLTHRMVSDRVLPTSARAVLGLGAVPPDL